MPSILKTLDMVISISEPAINHQFHLLRQNGIIQGDWNIVWFAPESPRPSRDPNLNQPEADFTKDLDDEDFDCAFNAQVGNPRIEILEGERKTLLFYIPFTSGTMHYMHYSKSGGKREEVNMKDWIYAFKVQIGQIAKSAKDGLSSMITEESKAAVQEVISSSGLDQSLFTIESLFLDLENANYTDFVKVEGNNLPVDNKEFATFQFLLSAYFKSLAKAKNPYILGYACTVPEIKDQQRSVFQPTALRYSTTYDSNNRLRALNYLLMTEGNKFSDSQDVGVFPGSLITDPDPNISGELTLSAESFCKNMFQALDLGTIYDDAFHDITAKKMDSFNLGWGSRVYIAPVQSFPGALMADAYGETAIPRPYVYAIEGRGETATGTESFFNEVSSIIPIAKFFDGKFAIGSSKVTVKVVLHPLTKKSKNDDKESQDVTFDISSFRGSTECSVGLGVADYTNTQQHKMTHNAHGPTLWDDGYCNTTVPICRIYSIKAGESGKFEVRQIEESTAATAAKTIVAFSKSVHNDLACFRQRMKDSVKGSMDRISAALTKLSDAGVILPCAQVYAYKDLRFEHSTEKTDISENTIKVKVTYQPVVG